MYQNEHCTKSDHVLTTRGAAAKLSNTNRGTNSNCMGQDKPPTARYRMENTKRELSLDFTKPRHPRAVQPMPSLVTPVLNLSTPEMNKMLPNQGDLTVLTPGSISLVIPQTPVLPPPLIPTTVNNDNIIKNNANNDNNTNGCSINNNNNLQNSKKCNGISDNQNQSHKKQRFDKCREVDVDKIEKKRERNRLAAKKCRQRKLETIEELRKTVSDWEQKYQRLERAFDEFKSIRSGELEALVRENAELKSMIARRS